MKLTIDLNKVAWIKQYWVNQFGQLRNSKPNGPTFLNSPKHPNRKDEDIWEREWHVQIQHRNIVLTGSKGLAIWETFNAKQYGSNKKASNNQESSERRGV